MVSADRQIGNSRDGIFDKEEREAGLWAKWMARVNKGMGMFRVSVESPEAIYGELSQFSGVTLYHDRSWHEFLEAALGFRVHACVARDRSIPVFFLPFVRKRRLLSRINVCLPLSHRVGPIWRNGYSPGNIDLRSQVWPIEIHDRFSGRNLNHVTHHSRTTIALDVRDEQSLFKLFHESSVQRKIRKAFKEGLTVIESFDEDDFVRFGQLQDLTRRRQGAPTYPENFFLHMARILAANHMAKAYLVEDGGRAVAGVIFLNHGPVSYYAYGASLPDRTYWRKGANQLAMWAACKAALQAGQKEVDFGSSPLGQPDLRIYKERFGGKSEEIVYSVGCDGARSPAIDQGGLMVHLGRQVLKHMPLPLYRRVSPTLLKAVI